MDLTGLDPAAEMLHRAVDRARRAPCSARLERGDVQALPHSDGVFDTVTATCVFCSVADPVRGLREVARVLTLEGRVLVVEHVRPRGRSLGRLADVLSPFVERLVGPAINRRTEESVAQAGLELPEVRRRGIWGEIVARRAL